MGNILQLNSNESKPSKKINKNLCYAVPVCIRTGFYLSKNKKKQLYQNLFEILRTNFQIIQETKMASRIRINFHSDSEAMINKQINMELYASYVYMAMACYFDRDDVALKGFAKRFADNSTEEREHAQKLISYQNMRGGRVVFQDIQKPIAQEWNSALHAIECQLELEQTVHKALLELHKVADSHGDAQLCDFIEGEYLQEQVTAEKEVGDLLTKMKRTGSEGLGLHIIDKELQG